MARSKRPAAYYIHEWYEKADIDYFGAFVKVYIPFNAWMNQHFPDVTKDREMINRVKTDINDFRDAIVNWIEMDDQDGAEFRGLIGSLHAALAHSTLSNNGEKISFENVWTGMNVTTKVMQPYHGINYTVEYKPSVGVQIEVEEDKAKVKIVNVALPGYPQEDVLLKEPQIKGLNQSRIDYLLGMYRQVNPMKKDSLLCKGKRKRGIKCGAYFMVKDTKALAAGIIEIIYGLRNVLFHGVINPNKDANRVYGVAYKIMHILMASLA